jgi:hypothetical protein
VRRFDHVVLNIGTKTVLRAEHRREPDAWFLGERVDDVSECGVDRSRVAENADTPAVKPSGSEQNFRAQADGH